MTTLKLAIRNLLGAGLRTWLNVIVLSLSFVVIVLNQGLLEGWDRQASRDTIEWEIGGGEFWHPAYDPYDLSTVYDGHGPVPETLPSGIQRGAMTPILMAQATIYPGGRAQGVLLKGIDPGQKILKVPSLSLSAGELQAVIGTRMAKSCALRVGDALTIRWRDKSGMFDAAEARIVRIMKTNVVTADKGQLWIPLEELRRMMKMPGEATIVVLAPGASFGQTAAGGWTFRDQDYLLKDIKSVIKMKTVGRSIVFSVLLLLALLAIFDTQVLSIFRRHREIGTLIALGMTKGEVIRLFTIEGGMHALLAMLAACAYGIPLLTYLAVAGIPVPTEAVDSMGIAMAERMFPVYTATLVVGTTLVVLVSVTIVSYLPTRRIAKLNPTDAIRGKIS